MSTNLSMEKADNTTIFILSGFSQSNAAWAEELVAKLHLSANGTIIRWKHWSTKNLFDFSVFKEAEKIQSLISPTQQYSIIAKSIGTLVAMYIIKKLPMQLGKLILCGIPLNDITDEEKTKYEVLGSFPDYKILCIQNDQDPHGSGHDVQDFLKNININIICQVKTAYDHNYPYFDDFAKFLG
jgi:hypothetical protein